MALSQNHSLGDFPMQSLHGSNSFPTSHHSRLPDKDCHDHMARGPDENRDASCRRLGNRCKSYKAIRSALKDKSISHNGEISNSKRSLQSENGDLTSTSSCTVSLFGDEELTKAPANEMYSTDLLKENYVCVNFEFKQLKECHKESMGDPKFQNINDDSAYSESSEHTLERKYTQVFHRSEPPVEQLGKVRKPTKKYKSRDEHRMENKENISIAKDNNKELKLILKTLKKILKSPPVASKDTCELRKLYESIKSLQEEQEKFRNVIKDQQDQLDRFHSKYLKAQNTIQTQNIEVQQLYTTNEKLKNELNSLQENFQNKLNAVPPLPRAVKIEKCKSEKLDKENCALIAKLKQVNQEVALTRAKLEEATQKRTKTLNKLKIAERDLKIFRTQNNTLKTEKRTLFEELRKIKLLNDDLKSTSSKNIVRQKERGETQQRLLRKKIIDLELELSQSRNSTNALVEERDKLIVELQMQLNTLVHNFEVSQKHIRILRRHIYSLSGNNRNIPENPS